MGEEGHKTVMENHGRDVKTYLKNTRSFQNLACNKEYLTIVA